MNTLLISSKTLKEDTFLCDNIGEEMLLPSIKATQDIKLQEILGTKLLNRILALVANDSIKEEEFVDYKYLLDEYITPFMEWDVMAQITIPLAFKQRNLGVVTTNDVNVSNVIMRDAEKLKDYYDSKASFYAIRLTKYLHANHDKYPEYCTTDSCADFKSRNIFHSSVYLG